MKKFQLNVSVERTNGVDVVLTTSGDFTASQVNEAAGIVKEAIEAEEDENATYSGSVHVFDSETNEDDLNINVSKAKKATILAIAGFFDQQGSQQNTNTPPQGEGDGSNGAGSEGTGTEGTETENTGTEGEGTEGEGTEGTGTEGTGTEGEGDEQP